MIEVGQTWSLSLKYPHRIEATVIELREDCVVAECVHRCVPATCYMQGLRNALPLHGVRSFFYDQFAEQFLLVPDGAIPLGRLTVAP